MGIAVGVDRNNVKHVYGRYVSALVPNVVPDALRSLYLEERKTEDIDHSLILGHDEEVDEILASPHSPGTSTQLNSQIRHELAGMYSRVLFLLK